jgi:hypothetical protein
MQENQISSSLKDPDNQIDIKELINILYSRKWIIFFITVSISITGVAYSLLLPNIYESKTLLSPVEASSNISRSLQNYSGLAGLAGVSLPSSENDNNSFKAIRKLNSLSFFEKKILPNIYLPDLMALKSWDYMNNKLYYDQSIFNEDLNVWVRKYSYPYKQEPSAQESFVAFKSNHFKVTEDPINGFVVLSIKHQSPIVAKRWAELMVNEINEFYRLKDKSDSEKAITYLNKKISMTNISEVKEAISTLLQEETKKLALIEANQFYVFEYIDPPVVMETKYGPNRALICILVSILGGILSIFYVLTKHYIIEPS